MPNKNSAQRISNTTKRWMVIVVVVIAILVVITLVARLLYDNYIGGPEYRAAMERCGGEPVAGYSDIKRKTDQYYALPTDALSYNVPSPSNDVYFCTEQEAIDAGYKHDPRG